MAPPSLRCVPRHPSHHLIVRIAKPIAYRIWHGLGSSLLTRSNGRRFTPPSPGLEFAFHHAIIDTRGHGGGKRNLFWGAPNFYPKAHQVRVGLYCTSAR